MRSIKRWWQYIFTFFLNIGLWFSAQAQPNNYITLHRGMIGHSIYNPGYSGKFDIHRKHGGSTFSYPLGRTMRVYSGGSEREGWNAKANGAGEGVWILSNLNGNSHVSAAGSETATDDIVGLAHEPDSWPEAYAGVVHHQGYALSIRTDNGSQAAWTDGVRLARVKTNWWRAEDSLDSPPNPATKEPVVIWNFRFNEYNSGETYLDRIAKGEIKQAGAPSWAESLSDDELPEVVGITRAKSEDTNLMWTRKWYQWGHQDYDKFLINETVVENTSGVLNEI